MGFGEEGKNLSSKRFFPLPQIISPSLISKRQNEGFGVFEEVILGCFGEGEEELTGGFEEVIEFPAVFFVEFTGYVVDEGD